MWPTTAAAPVSAASDAPPAARYTTETAAAPFAASSAITVTPRQAPVVRHTLAAPTLPLPATRTSIPARRASRNANGTEPARYPSRSRSITVLPQWYSQEGLVRRAFRREPASEYRDGADATRPGVGRDFVERRAYLAGRSAHRFDPRDGEVCG